MLLLVLAFASVPPAFFLDSGMPHAVRQVIKNRPSSSNPSRGIVTFEHRAFNQNGQACPAGGVYKKS